MLLNYKLTMWSLIKYLFYKIYKLFLKLYGKDDLPEYSAMLGVGTLLFMNLLSFIVIFNLIYPLYSFPDFSRSEFFIKVGIPYILILYFVFIYKAKYKKIIVEFSKENESERKFGRKKVILFVIFTLLFWVLTLILNHIYKK